jgi:hypothetical protein
LLRSHATTEVRDHSSTGNSRDCGITLVTMRYLFFLGRKDVPSNGLSSQLYPHSNNESPAVWMHRAFTRAHFTHVSFEGSVSCRA